MTASGFSVEVFASPTAGVEEKWLWEKKGRRLRGRLKERKSDIGDFNEGNQILLKKKQSPRRRGSTR